MWAAVNPTTNQQRNTKRPNTPANSIYEQLTNADDMIMLPWLCVLLHKSCDSLNQLSSWNLFLIDNPVLLSHFPCLTNEKAVIWAHTAVNHSNTGGDHFNFMNTVFFIQDRPVLFFRGQDNSIGGCQETKMIQIEPILPTVGCFIFPNSRILNS